MPSVPHSPPSQNGFIFKELSLAPPLFWAFSWLFKTQWLLPSLIYNCACSGCFAHRGRFSMMAVLRLKQWRIRGTREEGQLQLPGQDPEEWHLALGDGVPLTWLSQNLCVSQNAHCKEMQAIHRSRIYGSPMLGSFLPPSRCHGSLTSHQEVD